MINMIRLPRIKEADIEDEEINVEEENAEEEVSVEQVGDDTLTFNALLSMMETVRNDPGMLDMDSNDKKQMWPMIKRTLDKYAERLNNADTSNFRNFFRS